MSDGLHDSWEHEICTMPCCCNLVNIAPWCNSCRAALEEDSDVH